MIEDLFDNLWKQVREERRKKIETACERMITDPEQRGVLIIENQYGVVLSADLTNTVPYGTVCFVREEINFLDDLSK